MEYRQPRTETGDMGEGEMRDAIDALIPAPRTAAEAGAGRVFAPPVSRELLARVAMLLRNY